MLLQNNERIKVCGMTTNVANDFAILMTREKSSLILLENMANPKERFPCRMLRIDAVPSIEEIAPTHVANFAANEVPSAAHIRGMFHDHFSFHINGITVPIKYTKPVQMGDVFSSAVPK